MAQLRQDHQKFLDLNVKVIVVGPENGRAFETYFKQHDLPFTGVPDPKLSVLKLYGQEVNLFKLGRMPAQVIVDKKGFARYAHYGHSMADIPDNRELIEIIKDLEN